MRILYIANDVPYPPDNGVRIVTHHSMRLMHEAGHELALAVLSEDVSRPEKYFHEAAKYCREGAAWWMPTRRRGRAALFLSSVLNNRLPFIERYASKEFRRRLEKLVEAFQPDVMHFDLIPMTQYRDVVPPSVGSVASINDSWALALENSLAAHKFVGLELAYRQLEYLRVKRYEGTEYAKFNVTHVMSRRDEAYLLGLNPFISVMVISNGVDPSLSALLDRSRENGDIVFVGKVTGDNLKSLRGFVRTGWPIVREIIPQARLNVVGEVPEEARDFVNETVRHGNVVFKGYVDRLVDAYANCSVAIVPIDKECGIVNKAVEAMAAGLAVVGLEKTFSGIPEGLPGVHFVCARDYRDMGVVVAKLLQDRGRAAAIGCAARALVSGSYSWSSRGREYARMYALAATEAIGAAEHRANESGTNGAGFSG